MKFSQFKNLPSSPVHNSSLPFPNKRKNVPPHINSASFLRPQHSGQRIDLSPTVQHILGHALHHQPESDLQHHLQFVRVRWEGAG
jgi:hypothetical protein